MIEELLLQRVDYYSFNSE